MRKKHGVACVEVSHRLAVGGITHQRVPTLHTTETFFLWQAGPYITRQRVPLTVVYDRHPTTPCPSEESWPKHPSSTAIVRLLWTGLGPQTFLPSPDSLSLARSLFLSFIGLPPY